MSAVWTEVDIHTCIYQYSTFCVSLTFSVVPMWLHLHEFNPIENDYEEKKKNEEILDGIRGRPI